MVLLPDPDGAEKIRTLLVIMCIISAKITNFVRLEVKTGFKLAKKKKSQAAPALEAMSKRGARLRRVHRQVIYLNDKELAAVEEYCSRFGLKERSSIFREAAMERILAQLDDSHPTLF